MTAIVLDGKAAAADIKRELAERVAVLRRRGVTPGLGTLLVGDDPASHAYVNAKHRDCHDVGIESIRCDLPATATTADVRGAIHELNHNDAVSAYIVQLPLPVGLDVNALLEEIDPAKDADGLHPMNLGRLVLRVGGPMRSPLPCTPAGIVTLLERNGISLEGKNVLVIGRGITVGRSLGLLLTRQGIDATVTLAHSRTVDLVSRAREADVIIAAAGVPHLVKREWVTGSSVVVDVGVTRVSNPGTKATLSGDVAPDVASVAAYVSPNPGGVGPMTRVMLLANTVTAAEGRFA